MLFKFSKLYFDILIKIIKFQKLHFTRNTEQNVIENERKKYCKFKFLSFFYIMFTIF